MTLLTHISFKSHTCWDNWIAMKAALLVSSVSVHNLIDYITVKKTIVHMLALLNLFPALKFNCACVNAIEDVSVFGL